MSLDEILTKAKDKVKADFTNSRKNQVDYIKKYSLANYFGEDVPEEKRRNYESALEKKVDSAYDKYHDELYGVARKASSKGAMALAAVNDISAYASQVPIANVTAAGLALFGLKTAIETPAMIRYGKKSKDWYGIGTHLLLKPVRYVVPVAGAALESGAFERMVRKRVRKEAKDDFLKEIGKYTPFEERLKKKLKEPISDATYRKAA
jgi:hypothetical protein